MRIGRLIRGLALASAVLLLITQPYGWTFVAVPILMIGSLLMLGRWPRVGEPLLFGTLLLATMVQLLINQRFLLYGFSPARRGASYVLLALLIMSDVALIFVAARTRDAKPSPLQFDRTARWLIASACVCIILLTLPFGTFICAVPAEGRDGIDGGWRCVDELGHWRNRPRDIGDIPVGALLG